MKIQAENAVNFCKINEGSVFFFVFFEVEDHADLFENGQILKHNPMVKFPTSGSFIIAGVNLYAFFIDEQLIRLLLIHYKIFP